MRVLNYCFGFGFEKLCYLGDDFLICGMVRFGCCYSDGSSFCWTFVWFLVKYFVMLLVFSCCICLVFWIVFLILGVIMVVHGLICYMLRLIIVCIGCV